MLLHLKIQNFALLDRLEISFGPRLNVLTGETGAGKSILIDAIRFVLGERVDQTRGLNAEKNAVVEAVFEITETSLRKSGLLAEYLSEEDDLLCLKREWNAQGKSRSWINQKPVNISAIKEISACLIDIHGQYDHQQLLDKASHLHLVDRLADTAALKTEYARDYEQYRELLSQREELRDMREGREREMDLLKYQIEEIERSGIPEDNEADDLKMEQIRMANGERLHEILRRLLGQLDEDDPSVSALLAGAFRDIEDLARLDESVAPRRQEMENIQVALEEMMRALRDYREALSFDQDRLREIEIRLDQIEVLRRKYGKKTGEIQSFYEQTKQRYDQLLNSEVYEEEIERNLAVLLPRLRTAAEKISEKRKKAGTLLQKAIEKELLDLQVNQARFECRLEKGELGAQGQDSVEFLISLNPGQPLLPLSKIVSAGEVSRIMLALKKALMKIDPVLTLIFDEIDANIGGRLGKVIGAKLNEIAAERQVLLITHLPQIAAFADKHFKVLKTARKGETKVEYRELQGEERVEELSQMMSGKEASEISLLHAEEMLKRNK